MDSAIQENKDVMLKRLIYRSWHRGCKETDILLGDFAKQNLKNFNDGELSIYRAFIEESDWDLYGWVTGSIKEIPEQYIDIINNIRNFQKVRR